MLVNVRLFHSIYDLITHHEKDVTSFSWFLIIGVDRLLCKFLGEDEFFALWSPHVFADDAGGLDNAVAGNDVGDWVMANCCADCSVGFVVIDVLRDFAICGYIARWDLEKSLPDFDLKRCASEVEFESFMCCIFLIKKCVRLCV